MSKYSFKSLIKKKTIKAALAYLNKLKKKHSKVENIDHPNLTIQAYFSADDSEKTIKNVQDLFKIRSRMLEVKTNMKGNYTNYNCDECKIIGRINEEDCQAASYADLSWAWEPTFRGYSCCHFAPYGANHTN